MTSNELQNLVKIRKLREEPGFRAILVTVQIWTATVMNTIVGNKKLKYLIGNGSIQ